MKGYPEGLMSKHIVNLNVGDSLECKGPISKLPYTPNMKKKIGMVRILQVTSHVYGQEESKTYLLCLNMPSCSSSVRNSEGQV